MQARNEIAENNYLLYQEYFLREKELRFEEWEKSKSKWMGPPFIPNRKNLPETVFQKKTKQYFNTIDTNHLNSKNNYKTFLNNTKDPKRFQILNNFKEVSRIMTKNYLKRKDSDMSIMESEDSRNPDINKSSRRDSNIHFNSVSDNKNDGNASRKIDLTHSTFKAQTNYIMNVMKQLVAPDSVRTKKIHTQRE